MNELKLLMIEVKDQWGSNSHSSAWPYHLCSQAVVVSDPLFTSFLGCQTLVDHFPCLPGHTSKRWRELCTVSCIPLQGIKGQKSKGIELMVGGKPGLEQDLPAFAGCLPYPVLPWTQLPVLYTTVCSPFPYCPVLLHSAPSDPAGITTVRWNNSVIYFCHVLLERIDNSS